MGAGRRVWRARRHRGHVGRGLHGVATARHGLGGRRTVHHGWGSRHSRRWRGNTTAGHRGRLLARPARGKQPAVRAFRGRHGLCHGSRTERCRPAHARLVRVPAAAAPQARFDLVAARAQRQLAPAAGYGLGLGGHPGPSGGARDAGRRTRLRALGRRHAADRGAVGIRRKDQPGGRQRAQPIRGKATSRCTTALPTATPARPRSAPMPPARWVFTTFWAMCGNSRATWMRPVGTRQSRAARSCATHVTATAPGPARGSGRTSRRRPRTSGFAWRRFRAVECGRHCQAPLRVVVGGFVAPGCLSSRCRHTARRLPPPQSASH